MPASTNGRFRLFKGFVALVLCASFVVPQVVAPPVAKAAGSNAPKAAPPEPFVVPSSGFKVPSWLAAGTGTWQFLSSLIEPSKLPEGFGIVKAPSLGERFVAAITSPFRNAESSVSVPLPQPAGAVDFDFDGDGKSDLSRWHGSNTEFKIKNSNGGSFSTYTLGSSAAKPCSGRL